MSIFKGTDVEDFIFGEGTEYPVDYNMEESYISDEELNEYGVIECFDDPDVAGVRIALENEQNYNNVMMGIMQEEMAVAESGSEIVYEAGKVKAFFGTVMKMIKMVWSKLQGIYKKANDFITKYTKDNGAFIKRYEKADIKDVKGDIGEGYEYKKIKTDLCGSIVAEVKKVVDQSTIEKATAETYQDTVSKLNETKSADFKLIDKAVGAEGDKKIVESVKALVRGDKIDKLEVASFKKCIEEMKKGHEMRSLVKTQYAAAKSGVNNLLKEVQGLEKATGDETKKDASPRIAVAKCYVDRIKHAVNVLAQTQGAQLSCITEYGRQYRKMATYIIKNQPKKAGKDEPKAANESFGDTDFLAGVQLI